MTLGLEAAVILSAAVGVSLGLMGGGGSILAMPVLVYVAGMSPDAAVPMSLAMVGATSLFAGTLHARRGALDASLLVSFGGAGAVGALAGAQLTHLVSGRLLMGLFAALMIAVGGLMLTGTSARVLARGTGRRRIWVALLAGVAVGALTGFLGVGGGFLIVPALVLLAGAEMRVAIGTSLFIIAASSAAGLVAHLQQGSIPLGPMLALTTAALVGAVVGHRLAQRTSPRGLRRAFGGFVVLVGALVAAQSLVGALMSA